MAGFASRHQPLSYVWRGKVSEGGITIWTDISKWNDGRLPDIPVNAIAMENLVEGIELILYQDISWTRLFCKGL